MAQKCYNNQCNKERENDYDLCRDCIQKYISICTCNKLFITGVPKHFILGNYNKFVLELPNPIPEFFYTQLHGNLYCILGCRGCQRTEQISIQNNFNEALQASIISCIFQKYEENGQIYYEYLSDSLDTIFEDYCLKNDINIGEPAKIVVGSELSDSELSGPSGPSIEMSI
jgi:hypothetical protein